MSYRKIEAINQNLISRQIETIAIIGRYTQQMRDALLTIAAAKSGNWRGGMVNLREMVDDVAFPTVGQTCYIYDPAIIGKVIHMQMR